MNISEKVKQKLFNISLKERLVYKLLQVLTYTIKTSSDSSGFTQMPSREEVEEELMSLIDIVSNTIKEDRYISPRGVFDTRKEMELLLLMREEMLREIMFEISFQIGSEGFYGDQPEVVSKEILETRVDDKKGFLRNVYINISSKNNLMKFLTGTMFMCNAIEKDEIFNVDFEEIVDSVPGILLMVYSTEKFKETGEYSYLKSFSEDDVDLDAEVDEDNTEENVRDFIENLVENIKDTNSKYIKNMASSLIMQGRSQIRKK